MKTLITKFIAFIALFSMSTGFICKADETQLQLNEKSLTIYPIVLARPDKAIDEEMQKFGERIAEVVGYQLEQHGMRPGISVAYPQAIVENDSLAAVEQKFQAFVKDEATETDYALFAIFGVKPSKRGPAVSRICVVLTDAADQKVWSKEITEIPEGRMSSPMGAFMMMVEKIRSTSDLEEPAPDKAPYGPMARLMDQRNGLPPKPERDAMEKRFNTAYESFSEATLSIYPFRIWETEEGSIEGAEGLAEKLNQENLFKASAVSSDTHLVAIRDPDQPSQMKVLWDTARDFRNYLREHPPSTDYALLVDVTIPVHHVHIVLCDSSGEWVATSLMNSHHPEFEKIDPKTLEDCVELAFRRFTAIIQEKKEEKQVAEAVAAYKPDPRHFGKYTDETGYLELKPDGSFHAKAVGFEIEGTYAVVKENTLVLSVPGKGSRPVGKLEGNKLMYTDGDVGIKTEP